jgi:predicted transcriptional regulator of viral defense system
MKRVLLTRDQHDVLMQLLAEHGSVVTAADIRAKLDFKTAESERRFISTLLQVGWLVRIKNGLYQIADVSSLGMLTLSRYTIANLLVPDAYVSFLAALQFHGFFDQSLASISSVSLKQRPTVLLQGTRYRFISTQARYYAGFEQHAMDGQLVRIAGAEKALIDLMQFHRTGTTVDFVLEILRDDHPRLDLDAVVAWAQRSTLAVQRVMGFLLDTLQLGDETLAANVKTSPSISKLTPDSQQYSGKWRLYYDPYFVEQAAVA